MRRLIILLIFLVVSVWAGIHVMHHPGYLFIVYDPWTIQTPLWFALCSLLLLVMFLYYVITSVDSAQFLWFRFKNWLHFRRNYRAYSKTRHGLTLLIEGQLKKAEKLLLAGVQQETEPFINHVSVAYLAETEGDLAKANRYLEKAVTVAPDAVLAINILRATWQLKHNHIDDMRLTLHHLKALAPSHPAILKLEERLYVHTGDFEHLLALIPTLKKAHILTKENAAIMTQHVWAALLNAPVIGSLPALRARWQEVPRALRSDPEISSVYIHRLIGFGETSTAEDLIKLTLKAHWHAQLVLIYSTLPFAVLNKQYVIVGAWLKHYGPKPELYLALGRLCMRGQLWGKAKDYFEKCLQLGANSAASLELGMLYEQLGEPEFAKDAYRAGLHSI